MSQTLQFELTPSVAGWTIAEFQEHVAKEAGIDQTTDNNNMILRYMDIILQEILEAYDWPWAHSSSTFTTTGGLSGDYSLGETDFAYLDGPLQIQDKPEIKKVPLAELRKLQNDSNTEQGTPEYFAMTSLNSVVLHPQPDGVYTVSYDYTRQFASFLDLSTTEDLQIPLSHQNMLIYGVTWLLRQKDNAEDPITIRVMRRYEASIANYMYRDTQGEMVAVQGDIPAGY